MDIITYILCRKYAKKYTDKQISMIAKGNTKEFKADLILKVMPKFFNSIATCLYNFNATSFSAEDFQYTVTPNSFK